MNRFFQRAGRAAALLLAVSCLKAFAGDWTTIHNDNQRSGHTDEVIKGPYERKWYRDFHDEMIATRVQAIVAEGKCYVGTFAGNFYALNVIDGSTAWTYRANGPIGASPVYHERKLYVGDDAGVLHCVNAADGTPVWTFQAPAGIWVAPATDGNAVYFGDRGGTFHAVDALNGKQLWTHQTGGMILTPASISEDKKIVFGSEDMRVTCMDDSGKVLWKSEKLQGLSMRDHAPTLWKGLAIVRTNPADGFHEVMGRNGNTLKEIQQAIPIKEGEKVLLDKWSDYIVTHSPERLEAQNAGVTEYLKNHPYDQTFYAFDLKTGKQPWIAPIFYTCGLHNPPTAPTFNPKTGELFTLYRTAMTTYLGGVRRYSGIAKLDRETGKVTWTWPTQELQKTWHGMPMIGDETQALSFMGGSIVGTHQGVLAMLNPETLEVRDIWAGRDTYGGIFGPGAFPGKFNDARKFSKEGYLTGVANEWHGPDRSIVAIADGRIFWVVGAQVVCIAGKDIPATETGGTTIPAMIKSKLKTTAGGNLAGGMGGFDAELPKLPITAEQVERYITEAPARKLPGDSPLVSQARAKLDAAVTEAIDGNWAPLVIELGISGEEMYFWRTAETLQILSSSLPYLSPEVQPKTKAYLDKLVDQGVPLRAPVQPTDAPRRETYDLSPDMAKFATSTPKYQANIEDVHALWTYAQYADGWQKVLAQSDAIKRIFDEFASKGLKFDHVDADPKDPKGKDRGSDAAEHLNAQIAGVLAYGWIMNKAGNSAEVRRAADLLAALVAERIHHERADSTLIRQTRTASHKLHQSKVPRYLELCPELGDILRTHAGEAFARNAERLNRELPLWYHAYGERMMGGENYISPAHLPRAVFTAMAEGAQASPELLLAKLDQPWGKADLYYIEKLTQILRAAAR